MFLILRHYIELSEWYAYSTNVVDMSNVESAIIYTIGSKHGLAVDAVAQNVAASKVGLLAD